eukprot:122894-Amorphochlora_amoeboformis.AAC.1
MAFAIPPSVDGKLLCDASFNIDSAAMQIINLHTGNENTLTTSILNSVSTPETRSTTLPFKIHGHYMY